MSPRAKSMRNVLLLVGAVGLLSLIAVIGVRSLPDDSPEHGRLSRQSPISLARIGTIGDFPPADTTTVIGVDASGVMTVDGEVMSFETLHGYLRARADRSRGAAPPNASHWNVVLRLDRRLPWGVADRIKAICAHPDVRIWRIHLAVLPETGDAEGTLAAHEHFTPSRPKIDAEVRAEGAGSDVGALYERLKKRSARNPGQPIGVEVDPLVSVQDWMRVVDVFHRAGAGVVISRVPGAPGSGEGASIEDLMREARGRDVRPTIVLGGETIGSDPVAMPPGTRIRGGLAGTVAPSMGGSYVRRGGRRSLRAVGGGSAPLSSVGLGLDWLARHQSADGRWDCDGFEAQCPREMCGGRGGALHDPGVTGLALLAFTGAGETPKKGRFKKAVRDGLWYLMQAQDSDGCFGLRDGNRYMVNHGIATLAMTEAYGLTANPRYKAPAQAAIDFIARSRNPDRAWRYRTRPGDNDTSVTGWMVMALWSAKKAGGLRVPEEAFEGARAWLDEVTDPETGRVGYTARGTRPFRPDDLAEAYPAARSESLTAVGILIRVLTGEDPEHSEVIRKGAALCTMVPPRWDETDGSIDMLYWLHGSTALFQVGGEPWKAWNKAMKIAIIDHQRRDGDRKGSWDPVGVWGREGGRVASTALMLLCMEVYYRYGRVFSNR